MTLWEEGLWEGEAGPLGHDILWRTLSASAKEFRCDSEDKKVLKSFK